MVLHVCLPEFFSYVRAWHELPSSCVSISGQQAQLHKLVLSRVLVQGLGADVTNRASGRRPRRQRRSARHRHAPACSEPVPRSCFLSLHASRLLQRTAEAPERRVPKGPVLLPLGPQPRASPLSCCPRRARCRGPSPRHELWVCSPARKHAGPWLLRLGARFLLWYAFVLSAARQRAARVVPAAGDAAPSSWWGQGKVRACLFLLAPACGSPR